ncbi:hypothetical protein QJS10_CPA03g00386 [Acorus calamus]|uniref:AMP-activated protein kinase glycogen-binding domain-containing protein n=1 Tax=Acorus calamus TaxID=4465 RepID=A0AAV9F7K0_ACOCL|nr:hypothetical protein QJS10_CPA03g00386 [Acorus calamus]
MSLLRLPRFPADFTSPGPSDGDRRRLRPSRSSDRRSFKVTAMSDRSVYKMNLNEYMVTLERPLGIRFALSVDGRIFVLSLKRGGHAEKSRIVMVGDALKKAGASSDGSFVEIKDFIEAQQVPMATWSRALLSSNLQPSHEGSGNCGFVVFSPKFSRSQGWMLLSGDQNGLSYSKMLMNKTFLANRMSQIVGIFSEEEGGDVEWAYGNFPLEEYIKALDRSKGELYYNHSLGMRCSKITEQIYIGSCIQTDADVQTLVNDLGSRFHRFEEETPILCWSLVTITEERFSSFCDLYTGFDRSPACVIAYLHWVQDTALHAAHNFVTGLHSCRPDRPAIVWATWDLIAMVENGRHDGPPTHAVTFVWNMGCREGEEICLVGDFTGNWKEPVKAVHKGGSRYEVELRLRHGKYGYKFIVSGHWRHSTSAPTETDEHGNINNVIRVGDVARVRHFVPTQQLNKDPTVIKVIERTLTEDERFTLAYASRHVAFSVCPIRLGPK